MNEKTVVQRYLTACRNYAQLPIQIYREKKAVLTVTYEESLKTTAAVAAGLNALGIGRGEKVTVYSDNRPEWLIFNFALSGIGGVDVPRGTDTPFEELRRKNFLLPVPTFPSKEFFFFPAKKRQKTSLFLNTHFQN